jgi:hypothetical protein
VRVRRRFLQAIRRTTRGFGYIRVRQNKHNERANTVYTMKRKSHLNTKIASELFLFSNLPPKQQTFVSRAARCQIFTCIDYPLTNSLPPTLSYSECNWNSILPFISSKLYCKPVESPIPQEQAQRSEPGRRLGTRWGSQLHLR